jgi:hypothetical protein
MPAYDIARLRGLLAERRITHTAFAHACGLSIAFTSRILNGHRCGELARYKMADGLQRLGLDREVQHVSA